MTTVVRPPIAEPAIGRNPPGRIPWPSFLLAIFAAGCLTLVGVWFLFWDDSRRPAPATFNRDNNAAWLAHTWVEDPKSDAEIAELADRLRHSRISDIYAHVGPLNADGTIPADRYPRAREFVRRVKAAHGGFLRVFAWVGQIEARGGGVLDLTPPERRRRVAETAVRFPTELGFDGVHYDIEPIFDADDRFLALLDETRRRMPHQPISVATGKWVPDGPVGALGKRLAPRGALWTTSYYNQVARRSDQVVAMLYDTGVTPGALYQRAVTLQLAGILRATAGTGASVLAGVPTYDQPSDGHDPASENLDWALPGVAAAVDLTGNPRHFAGVAIYPHWQTSLDEWATYDARWIGSDADRP